MCGSALISPESIDGTASDEEAKETFAAGRPREGSACLYDKSAELSVARRSEGCISTTKPKARGWLETNGAMVAASCLRAI